MSTILSGSWFIFAMALLTGLVSFCDCQTTSPANSPFYRNVKDFGAKGDGVTDDTQAFIKAITTGRGQDPNAPFPNTKYVDSTTHACQIFVPSGTYVITSSIPLVYYTQLIGDYHDLPTLLVKSSSAVSLRVLDALDPTWSTSINQNNFYRLVRNLKVDMTQCTNCVGAHWQVAQATALINVHFNMGTKGNQNQGIWMENGSGGYLSDCTFTGGLFGMWVGSQQFTQRNVTFTNCKTAIYLNWDWNWTFKSVRINNCDVGIDVGTQTGSLVVFDSQFTDTPIGIRTGFSQPAQSSTGLPITYNQMLIDNIVFSSTITPATIVVNTIDTTHSNYVLNYTATPGTPVYVRQWAQGHVWQNTTNTVKTVDLSSFAPPRPDSLTSGSLYNNMNDLNNWRHYTESNSSEIINSFTSSYAYFEQMRPNFDTFLDVSTLGIIGDGITDVTLQLQNLFNDNAGLKNVLFFPHGIYIITKTVIIPPGIKMFGQAWTVFAARGAFFSDPLSPQPMIQVGQPGDVGVVHMMDFIFSNNGTVPGAILLQWHMRDPVGQPGSNAMWNTHFRVGGAVGTGVRDTNCPADDGSRSPSSTCSGAWALMHIGATASLYMENVWGWVADHDIDDSPQLNVYSARGLLCEAQEGPVWMYGSAFEHSVLYQYNFHNTKNILLAMIQTETPYYQPSSKTPFRSLISVPSDPTYCSNDFRCEMAYAVVVTHSSNIYTYGAGLYSFFNVWNQACLKASAQQQPICQLNLVYLYESFNIYTYALSTYGSIYGLTVNEPYSFAESNLNTFCSTVIVNMNTNYSFTNGTIPTPANDPTTSLPTSRPPVNPTTSAPPATTLPPNTNNTNNNQQASSNGPTKTETILIVFVVLLGVFLIGFVIYHFCTRKVDGYNKRSKASRGHSHQEPFLNEMSK